MLGAGAVGYLVKGTSAGQILDAIRCSARGHGSLSSEVTADVIKTLAGQLKQEEFETLRRQSEVRQVQRLLEGQGFWLLFQPVLDLVGGGRIGYEALARFDPERTRPPTVWFERAAALGKLTELEMVTVRGALARLGAIPPEAFLAVNVSPSTLASPPFLETLSGVPGERIVLEVTEHARVEDYDALNEALRRLRSRGVRLAIDDAGAGFASLQHIVRLAPDYIKLDITLTRGIDADPVRRALATALITFAHEIGASMIAEGIETDAEFETLRALGVAFGQGFFLGEPGPLHQQDAFPDPSPTPLDAWIPSAS
jgi:EAL domain-containing protein (putative c-di-GMP-specific phosphodiesterase class I)